MMLAVLSPTFGRFPSSAFREVNAQALGTLGQERRTCASRDGKPPRDGVWLVGARAPAPHHRSSQNLFDGINRTLLLGFAWLHIDAWCTGRTGPPESKMIRSARDPLARPRRDFRAISKRVVRRSNQCSKRGGASQGIWSTSTQEWMPQTHPTWCFGS
jgi:hypothetical protein